MDICFGSVVVSYKLLNFKRLRIAFLVFVFSPQQNKVPYVTMNKY